MPVDNQVRARSVYRYRAWNLPQHETGTINIRASVSKLPEVRTLDQELIIIYCRNWYRLHAELPWLI
jgi:hypothetical protein